MTSGAGGAARALVAVQRYGEGRSMVFTGEAVVAVAHDAAVDRSHPTTRSGGRRSAGWRCRRPIRSAVGCRPAPSPGDVVAAPRRGAQCRVRAAARRHRRCPRDRRRTAASRRCARRRETTDGSGRRCHFAAISRPSSRASIGHGGGARGGSQRSARVGASMLVGGADLEMTDPRLNTPLLAAGRARVRRPRGRSQARRPRSLDALRAGSAGRARSRCAAISGTTAGRSRRSSRCSRAEWMLRRRWGLR